jgi:Ca2+-transporting ATPase
MVTDPHALPADVVCRSLGVDPAAGLGEEEARRRLARHGRNELPDRPPPSWGELVLRQLRDALVLLLLGAAVVAVAVGDVLEAGLIATIVVLNTVLGAVQEGRAESAAAAVRALLPQRAHAVRGGAVRELDAAEVVPGDVLLLGAGDHVPADGRVVEARDAEIDESLLTGESLPVGKGAEPAVAAEAPLAERSTMAYTGTTAVRGHVRIAVTATGGDTEAGRTAELGGEAPPPTPLQQRLDRLASALLVAIVGICGALALISWAYGDSPADALLTGVSLAVAAVPEGLTVVVTLTAALGVRRLARRHGIVRRLRAVETLGSVSVVCSDKTGTLTTNRMVVNRIHALATDRARRGRPGVAGGPGGREPPGPDLALLKAAVLASDPSEDPEDRAIAGFAGERGVDLDRLAASLPVVGGRPFDSERKRMSVVVDHPDGRRVSYVKGAPEAILPRLTSDDARRELDAVAREWAAEGVRVLVVAARELEGEADDAEDALDALGVVGMRDPPRETAAPSVAAARAAGIRTVMVTGDHPRTAAAIAAAIGIAGDREPHVITGPELDRMGDDELARGIEEADVFARVVPGHKLRIVQSLVDAGEVVAVTGDGVNDVPALRASHVGVAMGSGGTDAAIDAADVVLADNDFGTIVVAVEEGRTIYRNILRFLGFLLAGNAGEVLAFTLAVPAGLGAPLTVPQILLVNLLFDGPPAVALGVDPSDPAVMSQRPRPLSEGVLTPIRGALAIGGVTTGIAVFASYLIGHAVDADLGVTMAFATLAYSRLLFVFAIRGRRPLWRGGRNPALMAAAAGSGLVASTVLLARPLHDAFGIVPMAPGEVAAALALALLPATAMELAKLAQRLRSRSDGHPA